MASQPQRRPSRGRYPGREVCGADSPPWNSDEALPPTQGGVSGGAGPWLCGNDWDAARFR
jgi:hypothetical protein